MGPRCSSLQKANSCTDTDGNTFALVTSSEITLISSISCLIFVLSFSTLDNEKLSDSLGRKLIRLSIINGSYLAFSFPS